MRGQLVVVVGPDQGRTFFLEEGQTLVVGRGQNTETKLKDPQVSRVHCHVRFADGRLHLTDPGSSTGTLVGGRKVVQHDFLPGESFQIGATGIRFELEGSPEASTVVMSGAVQGLLEGRLNEAPYHHLTSRMTGDVLVLTLTENQVLDETLAEAIRLEMLMAVARTAAQKVVLDFHAVMSASDDVVRPVASLHARVQERAGRLVLCGLMGMPAQVLRMSGLIGPPAVSGQTIETQADAAAALARLQKPA